MEFHFHDAAEGENPDDDTKSMREFLGPQAVDNAVRQAISTCWVILPEGKRSVDAVEAEVRRVVERALANLRDDASAFGIPAE
jgi:hypothetical protein